MPIRRPPSSSSWSRFEPCSRSGPMRLADEGGPCMKTVTCWNDLQPLGIIPLTGEACGLMYRILFDVTEKGRKVLSKCYGIPNMSLPEPWNSGSKDDPH